LGVRTIKEIPVAAKCDVCAKGPGFGHNVPWSKKKTNRRWNPNIQRVRAVVGGTAQRTTVGTPGLKAGTAARGSPPHRRRPACAGAAVVFLVGPRR
jgi:large subunit ribosomal protein L28